MSTISNLGINNQTEAINYLEGIKNTRDSIKSQIINQQATSKFTKNIGTITDVTRNNLFVNYECWESIPLSISSYGNAIELDEEVINQINLWIKSFKEETALRSYITRCSKESSKEKLS